MRTTSVALTLVALASMLGSRAVQAQVLRPGDERPELGEFAEPVDEPALQLPAIPPLPEKQRAGTSSGRRILVEGFRVTGSTVFSEAELAEVLAPYLGRELGAEELIGVRDVVTRLYIAAGYVTSGAVLPGQRVEDGVVEIRVVEGVLAAVEIEGTEHFRASYFRSRIERAAAGPLNVRDLEQRLQLFQQDPRIRRVLAEVRPGEVKGESFLSLVVEEESPYGLSFYGGNLDSPSIGSERGEIRVAHQNLSGNGDSLQGSFAMTDGLDEWSARYSLPLSGRDTLLEFGYERSESDLVESPFDRIDIHSESTTYSIGLRHPLYRTARTQVWAGIRGDLRRSETFILGEGFGFPGSGAAEDGKTRATVLRVFGDWTSRTQNWVLAARSTFSFGIDAFDASDERVPGSDVRTPDGTFFTWLGQFQWAQRLSKRWRGSDLVFRTDVQLTPGPLLSMEKFSLGGFRTVRGYRENELVRDNAIVSSLELRVPILRTALGGDILQLAPFIDYGHSWNDQVTLGKKTLPSIGIGLRYRLSDRVFLEGYWGGRLRSVETRKTNLQNHGIHIQATVRAF